MTKTLYMQMCLKSHGYVRQKLLMRLFDYLTTFLNIPQVLTIKYLQNPQNQLTSDEVVICHADIHHQLGCRADRKQKAACRLFKRK